MHARMWLFLFLFVTLTASAQSTYNFSIPGDSWVQWERDDNAAQATATVVSDYKGLGPSGLVEIHGINRDFWELGGQVVHQRWLTTDGTTAASVDFQFAGSLHLPGWLDMWTDGEQLFRDCFFLNGFEGHPNVVPPIVSEELQVLTLADTGQSWVGAYVGDLSQTLGIKQKHDLTRHDNYVDAGLIQKMADGTLNVLTRKLLKPLKMNRAHGVLSLILYQQAGKWIALGGYQFPNGSKKTFTAGLIEAPDVFGSVGLISSASPAHSCMGDNRVVRLFQFDQVIAH